MKNWNGGEQGGVGWEAMGKGKEMGWGGGKGRRGWGVS